jgi:hypothetical protein
MTLIEEFAAIGDLKYEDDREMPHGAVGSSCVGGGKREPTSSRRAINHFHIKACWRLPIGL